MQRKIKWDVIIMGIISVLIGIILVGWPAIAVGVFIYLLGAILIAAGVLTMIRFFSKNEERKFLKLLLGLILIAIGIILMVAPIQVELAMCLVFGIMLLANGIQDLIMAIELKRRGFQNQGVMIALSIITMVLAIILLSNLAFTFIAMTIIVRIIGIFIIFNGFVSIFFAGATASVVERAANAAQNAFNSMNQGFAGEESGDAENGYAEGMKNTPHTIIKDDVQDADFTEFSNQPDDNSEDITQ